MALSTRLMKCDTTLLDFAAIRMYDCNCLRYFGKLSKDNDRNAHYLSCEPVGFGKVGGKGRTANHTPRDRATARTSRALPLIYVALPASC